MAAFFPSSSSSSSGDGSSSSPASEAVDEVSDPLREMGVILVSCSQKTLAVREANVTAFPALVLFRNGLPLKYPGDLAEDGPARCVRGPN